MPKTLVKTAIVAAVLVANLSSAEALSGVTVSDDFEDATLNSRLWSVTSTNGATATQTGGALETRTPANQDLSEVDVGSLVALTGDFDVTVAYGAADLSNYWMAAALYVLTCDGRNGMVIHRTRSMSCSAIESVYFVDGVELVPTAYWTLAGSYVQNGKFRITRIGNTLTSYFGAGDPLQQLVSQTETVFAGPVRIHLHLYSNNMGTPGTAPEAFVRWDDLSAHSQGATGCP